MSLKSNDMATRELPSVCPLDCPDTCSLAVTVEGDRIAKVRGSQANPFTAGVICSKVARSYPDFVHGERRIRHPMRRIGRRGSGEFEPLSWEEAIDRVHDGFTRAIDRYGPESVLPFNYAGPHGELAAGSMDYRFFHRLGATRLHRGPLCGAVRGTAYTSLYGNAPGMDPEQAVHADLILVWGNNVTVSNLHFARVLKAARERGTKLVVIDPKRIRVAEQADLHLQVNPGTDVVLALALAAELERQGHCDQNFIDRWVLGDAEFLAEARRYTLDDAARICGLDRERISDLLLWIASARNMASSFGNGIERGRSGSSSYRAAMALHALTGQHGRLGAGILAKPGLAIPKTSDRLQRPDLAPEGTRVLNIVDLGRTLCDDDLNPPIRAMLIYNHNPIATHPDQKSMIRALSREEIFIAGCDIVMTDSMAFADVILPAASHFESHDIYGAYGSSYVQRATPVIGCVGEALPNTEIFRRLAARFGFNDPVFHASDEELMNDAMDAGDPRFTGTKPSELPTDTALMMGVASRNRTSAVTAPPILCKNHVPQTPSGRIELASEDLERRFAMRLPRYRDVEASLPLTLISPSSSKRTNATFGGCPESAGREQLEMHPSDAIARELADGDIVIVWNGQGEVDLELRLSEAVKPGVVYCPKGSWRESSSTGFTVNALIPATIRADIEGGACYNETHVDVRLAGGGKDLMDPGI